MNIKPNEKFIYIDEMQVSYFDEGHEGVPIILVHGFPFCKETWLPQLDFLSFDFRVIAYDIRGFGKSSSSAETPVSIEIFANDLILLMDSLHIEKAIVCGFSMGGYIVLNALYLHSNRFIAAILCDTQSIADSVEAKAKREKTILQIEANGLQLFAADFVNNIFDKETLATNNALVVSIHNIIIDASISSVVATLRALANRSESGSTLNQISIPTLIICGENDKITPVQQSKDLQEKMVKSSLFVIKNAGHMSILEQADQVNTIIKNFITALPKEISGNLYGVENSIIKK